MENIVANGITTTPFFATSGKYHGAIWISIHAVMASHICSLRL